MGFYCSKECQVADWKNHKAACKEMGAGTSLPVVAANVKLTFVHVALSKTEEIALSDRSKTLQAALLQTYMKYLDWDTIAAYYSAFRPTFSSSLRTTHVLFVKLNYLPLHDDPSLAFEVTSARIMSIVDLARLCGEDPDEFLAELRPDNEHIEAMNQKGLVSCMFVIQADTNQDEVRFELLDVEKEFSGPKPQDARAYLGMMDEGEDWEAALKRRSKLSAIKKVPGAPQNMTERELDRWQEGVSRSQCSFRYDLLTFCIVQYLR